MFFISELSALIEYVVVVHYVACNVNKSDKFRLMRAKEHISLFGRSLKSIAVF